MPSILWDVPMCVLLRYFQQLFEDCREQSALQSAALVHCQMRECAWERGRTAWHPWQLPKLVWVAQCAVGRGNSSWVWFLLGSVYEEKPLHTVKRIDRSVAAGGVVIRYEIRTWEFPNLFPLSHLDIYMYIPLCSVPSAHKICDIFTSSQQSTLGRKIIYF